MCIIIIVIIRQILPIANSESGQATIWHRGESPIPRTRKLAQRRTSILMAAPATFLFSVAYMIRQLDDKLFLSR